MSSLRLGMLIVCLGVCPAAPARAQTAADAASELVNQILTGTPQEAAEAVSEAFAWAGVATYDGDHEVRPAVAPTIPLRLSGREARRLAGDARARASGGYRMTLEDLGEGLGQLGWKTRADLPPGRAMGLVVGHLIANAWDEPESPHSFVPLFLWAMAEATTPGAGLNAESMDPAMIDPAQVPLSLLEARLLLELPLRGNESREWSFAAPAPVRLAWTAGVPSSLRPVIGPASLLPTHGWLPPISGSGNPCNDFFEAQGDAKPFWSTAADWITSLPFERAMDNAGMSDAAKNWIGGAGVLLKLLKLAASTMDNSIVFELEADPDTFHYTHPTDEPSRVPFNARVELVADRYETDHDRMEAECLAALGFTTDDTRDAVAAAMQNWVVVWNWDGLGPHGQISQRYNEFARRAGRRATQLGVHGYTGGASLIVDLKKERDGGSDEDLDLRFGRMTVHAALDQSQPPDFSVLLKAGIVGVTGLGAVSLVSLTVDVLDGLWKKLTPRKDQVSVVVSWHERGSTGWRGTITYETIFAHQHNVSDATGVTNMNSRSIYTAQVRVQPAPATSIAQSRLVHVEHTYKMAKDACRPTEARAEGEGTGVNTDQGVDVEINEENGTYSITLNRLPAAEGRAQTSIKGQGCPGVNALPDTQLTVPLSSDEVLVAGPPDGYLVLEGKIDPKNPGVIAGSRKGDDGNTSISWRLVRR